MRTACCYELFVSVESLALLWLGWFICFACILQYGNSECFMYECNAFASPAASFKPSLRTGQSYRHDGPPASVR